MKLSESTVEILKNFSTINQNILIKSGNSIATIAEAKNVLAKASLQETFPREFAIFALPEFLSVISLVNDPELEFGTDSVTIKDSSPEVQHSIEYYYSSPSVITAPTKEVNMPTAEVSFMLKADSLLKLKRASSVLGHTTLEFRSDSGKINARIVDPKNPTAHKYDMVMDAKSACNGAFSFIMSIGNLKMMPGDYEVSISSKLISHFKNTSIPIEYWVALEKNSSFTKS